MSQTPDERTAAPEQEAGPDEIVEALLEERAAPETLASAVADQEAPDAADTIERLERDEQAELVQRMENPAAADALAYMPAELASTVVEDLADDEAAALIALMDPDDAADILQLLPEERRSVLLGLLHPRRAAVLAKLSLFDPESAGGLMTTDIAVVRANMTIGQAIERIKRDSIGEHQPAVFCVDDQKRLLGSISLRSLLVIDDAELVADHLRTDIEPVLPEVDQEEVARLFDRYDYLTLPVVDHAGRVLGMITIDDIVDTITAETTEDAMKQVGAGAAEAVYSTVRAKLKGRAPWLLVNLATATLAAIVLLGFQDLIERIAVAAVIFPIIANQCGNTGYQSLAVTLRGLVLGEIRRERVRPLIVKEAGFGVVMGLGTGVVVLGAVTLLGLLGDVTGLEILEGLGWRVGLVAGSAMAAAMCVACLVGTAIPLFMQRCGIDPATASSIFLTMLTDMLSFATFLGLVFLTEPWLAAAIG